MALSLYDTSITAVCENFKVYQSKDIRLLPELVLFDVYIGLYRLEKLCILGLEFGDLDVFNRILKSVNDRIMLLKCFQALMRHGTQVAKELTQNYVTKCTQDAMSPSSRSSTVDLGIRLGGFLCDAGWYYESAKVLSHCRDLCLELPPCPDSWRTTLECLEKLLHAETVYSLVHSARATKELAESIVKQLHDANERVNLACLYSECSLLSFCVSNYDEAHKWSAKAVLELGPNVSPKVTVDTLIQASKACVVKRDFTKAAPLVRYAVYLAGQSFGEEHPKYADALLSYAYYLLNSDSIKESVTVYERALRLKQSIFGNCSLHVAAAHEDLAYALYVHDYSSGRFTGARHHAEIAIDIMTQLLHNGRDHLMLASAQRVQALILEEIALENSLDFPINSNETQEALLKEAEELHQNNVRLAKLWFGDDNVQIAKHYGNLGRLYQTMKKYEEAEAMHLKAIATKKRLLGGNDFEVGLSIGHLASLYNYHMKEYKKAEELYLKSVQISLKLFSESYSGLEYDYRGLIHVYNALGDAEKTAYYTDIMNRWRELTEERKLIVCAPLVPILTPPCTINDLKILFDPQ